ncbi:MAG: O-antigen ligase [Chitinophagales bacterium]
MNNLYKGSAKVGDKLFVLGSVLMVILLPIHKMSTTIAFTIMLIGFVLGKKSFKGISHTSWILFASICAYFLFHVVSYFLSTNKIYAFDDLFIKAPLLLLPLMFIFRAKLSNFHTKLIMNTFILSNLAMGLVILFRFVIHYAIHAEFIMMDQLLDFTIMHPSYLSISMILGLLMWLVSSEKVAPLKSRSAQLAGTVVSTSSIFLLGSRMAILVLIFVLLGLVIARLGALKGIISAISILLLAVLITINIPYLNERFSKAANMFTHSAIEVNEYIVDDRLMTWKNSLELIKEKPIWGYGLGDYRFSILSEKHNVSGFGKGYRQKLNAHNQFMESWLALGVLGFISLISIYLIAGYISIKNHQLIFAVFLMISILFATVESTFQSQGGIMFFGFFIAFFIQGNHKELKPNG